MKGRENLVAGSGRTLSADPRSVQDLRRKCKTARARPAPSGESLRANASSLGSGLPVQAALRKLGQSAVGVVFLLERLVEQRRRFSHAELVRPSDQRAITSDLVMLNGLRVGNHARIEDIRIGGFLHVLGALFEDSFDGGAGLAGGFGVA